MTTRLYFVACFVPSFTMLGCSGKDQDTGRFEKIDPEGVGTVEAAMRTRSLEDVLRNTYDRSRVRHSFKTQTSHAVDCIDREAQPGFAERREPIEEASDDEPTLPDVDAQAASFGLPLGGDTDEDGETRACPPGTVPFLRPDLEIAKHYRSVSDYFSKRGAHAEAPQLVCDTTGANCLYHDHSHGAQALANFGIFTVMSVNKPNVATVGEFSLSQVWVVAGATVTQTVEAGWVVQPSTYGDTNPHFFIFSTNDGYKTGCWNNACGNFVQTNTVIFPGMVLSTAAIGSPPPELTLYVYRDKATGNWWVVVNGNKVGYYPKSNFNAQGLRDQATVIDAGGEVTSPPTGPHTKTWMGTNHFASSGYPKAAFHHDINYWDVNLQPRLATLTLSAEAPKCYTVNGTVAKGGNWPNYFYFGGPGAYLNAGCKTP